LYPEDQQMASLADAIYKPYGPIFLYGNPGAGKTVVIRHLLADKPGAFYLQLDRNTNPLTWVSLANAFGITYDKTFVSSLLVNDC
jgi:hypothetical protein